MSKPEIDWDKVWHAVNMVDHDQPSGNGSVAGVVQAIRDEAYEAGRQDVLHEGIARTAMLEQQAKWLEEVVKATGPVGRVVAEFVASAFATAAETYRNGTRPTLDPSIGLCGSSEPHDQHRFDEDYVDGKLVSWRTCQGIVTS